MDTSPETSARKPELARTLSDLADLVRQKEATCARLSTAFFDHSSASGIDNMPIDALQDRFLQYLWCQKNLLIVTARLVACGQKIEQLG